jgi:hypothetical protein
VTAAPPSLAGGPKFTVIEALPATVAAFAGALGPTAGLDSSNKRFKIGIKSNGVTALDGADAGPEPTELLAVTAHV